MDVVNSVNNTITGSGSTTASTAASPSSSSSNFSISEAMGGGDLGKDQFLQLLVTELKHQDPLKPKDDKSFIAELAQFSSLERAENTYKAIEELVSLQKGKPDYSYLNFIGKKVEYTYTYTNPVTYETMSDTATGIIDSIKLIDGKPEFYVGEQKISLSDITQIIY